MHIFLETRKKEDKKQSPKMASQKTEKMFTGIERCPHFFVFLQTHEAYIKQI